MADFVGTKSLGRLWFTLSSGETIGIIAIDNGYEIKFYMGLGLGIDEDDDAKLIAAFGSPVSIHDITEFISKFSTLTPYMKEQK